MSNTDWTEEEMAYIAREEERREQREEIREAMEASDTGEGEDPIPEPMTIDEAAESVYGNADVEVSPNPYAYHYHVRDDVVRDVQRGFQVSRELQPDLTVTDYGNLLDSAMRQQFLNGYSTIPTWSKKAPRTRGFELVSNNNRKYPDSEPRLPERAESRSAGYDFHAPIDYALAPGEKYLMWTEVKAYMLRDDVLYMHIRSSLAVKFDIVLANGTGVIDASYYDNENNEGNIGICLKNTGTEPYFIQAGDRIAQGVFHDIAFADDDNARDAERVGGFGSTGR